MSLRSAAFGCAGLLLLSAPAHALVSVVGAGMAHDCFIARQFEFDGKPDGLVAAVAEQTDAALLGHEFPLGICRRHAPKSREGARCIVGNRFRAQRADASLLAMASLTIG